MKLNSPWYELVRDGKKIYEGRRMPYTEKYKVCDIVEISHYIDDSLPSFFVVIEQILYFENNI